MGKKLTGIEAAHAARTAAEEMKASGRIRRGTGTDCKAVVLRECMDNPTAPCTQCGRSRRIMHETKDRRVFCEDCCPGPECWPYGPEREQALADREARRKALKLSLTKTPPKLTKRKP